MRRALAMFLALPLLVQTVVTQTTPKPQQASAPEDVVRITTNLVQTDAVVTDKNEQIIKDLKLEDFELFDNGRKQDLQFMEFVSVDAPPRSEGVNSARVAGVDTSVPHDVTAKDIRRVIAFVVDDVTIANEDMVRVRQLLRDYIENKMAEGDLVSIVRTVGGNGLLEQLTSDRNILRRAISQLSVRSIPPYMAFSEGELGRVTSPPSPLSDGTATETVNSGMDFQGPNEGTNQVPRAVLALSVSNQLIDGLREIPGRKNLVLLSGGLPLFDLTRSGSIISDVGQTFRLLTDNAIRAGVVINTLDVRGLSAAGAVAKFVDTPAKSALGGGTFAGNDENPNFGRGADLSLLGDRSLTDQLSLRGLAGSTGGVAVVNTNNFGAGLDKVLNQSSGYYRLAYKPSERFDNKFHKVEIKVRRSGMRVYTAEGYFAHEEKKREARTKEDEIMAAARSPLAKRDIGVSAELQYRFSATNQAQLDINTVIDARKLNLKRTADGKYHSTFDVVGFVFDQLGKSRGGISQTVNAELTEEGYQRALATGVAYTASTELPPGYYQVRLVVREAETGNMGTVSRYFEVPDLSNKQLTMSSILLYAVDPPGGNKTPPEQLTAARVIPRKQDLRYAAVVYNGKLESSKPKLRSRLIISQNDKMLFQEPEQPVESPGGGPGQFVRVGQIGLSKVPPGRYVLTLVVTDPLADKKRQTVTRSVDFTVVN